MQRSLTLFRWSCSIVAGALLAGAARGQVQPAATGGAPASPAQAQPSADGSPEVFDQLIAEVDALAAEGLFDEAMQTLDTAESDQEVLASTPVAMPALEAKRAQLLALQGQYEPARAKLESAKVLASSLLGPSHPFVASYVVSQAELDAQFNRPDRAIIALREAVRLERSRIPWNHARIVSVSQRLGELLLQTRQLDAADRTFRDALEMLRQSGASVPVWVWSGVYQSYGRLLVDQGQADRAVTLLEQLVKQWQQYGEEARPAVASAQLDLATILLRAGRTDEALAQVRASRASVGAPEADDWRALVPSADLTTARLLRRLGEFEPALTLLANNKTALTQLPPEQAAAMGLSPAWLDAERVLTLTAAGRYAEVADELTVLMDRQPDDGLALDRWVALSRAGQRDAADNTLRAYVAERPAPATDNDPTAMLLDVLLEKRDPSEVVKVGADWPTERRLEYLCTAFYYMGQRAMIANNTSLARDQFTRAVRTGRAENPAHELSQRELQRLK